MFSQWGKSSRDKGVGDQGGDSVDLTSSGSKGKAVGPSLFSATSTKALCFLFVLVLKLKLPSLPERT